MTGKGNQLQIKQHLNSVEVTKRFEQLLGEKAQGFVTSVLQIVNSNELLQKSSKESVLNAAMTAATMDLPINNNLGFAYIVPYKGQAQFQVGYKGYIQLAQRSGRFKSISASEVYEGELVINDRLRGPVFDWNGKVSENVVGYVCHFSLLNGFEKTLYMTREQVETHAKKYSQSYRKGVSSVWRDDFNSMAIKTVIKTLLSRYAPLSIEMQTAVTTDQLLAKNSEVATIDVNCVDVRGVPKAENEALGLIQSCKSLKELEKAQEQLGDEWLPAISERAEQLEERLQV